MRVWEACIWRGLFSEFYGNLKESWMWIPDTLPVELGIQFLILAGFRIPWAEFRVPKTWIPDSTSKKVLDSGIRIPLDLATVICSSIQDSSLT